MATAQQSPQQPRAVAPARRGGARPAPERSAEFAHLSLDGLRAYREQLTSEEGRVSYWRRILQARLDVVRAVDVGVAASDNLRDVLTGMAVQSSRTALLSIVDADDMPPLPDLGPLWSQEPVPGDVVSNAVLATGLEEAERRLSDYRTALLRRLELATGELIARYREDPRACLVALPVR